MAAIHECEAVLQKLFNCEMCFWKPRRAIETTLNTSRQASRHTSSVVNSVLWSNVRGTNSGNRIVTMVQATEFSAWTQSCKLHRESLLLHDLRIGSIAELHSMPHQSVSLCFGQIAPSVDRARTERMHISLEEIQVPPGGSSRYADLPRGTFRHRPYRYAENGFSFMKTVSGFTGTDSTASTLHASSELRRTHRSPIFVFAYTLPTGEKITWICSEVGNL